MALTISYGEEDRVPQDLALAYDFLNSVDERRFVRYGRRHRGGDQIATTDYFRAWLTTRGLVKPDQQIDERDLRLAHELREGIRRLLQERETSFADQGGLSDTLERLPLVLGIDAEGALRLQSSRPGVAGVLTGIAVSLATAVVDGRWRRLKVCAADDCRWVFYDHSKPRTGRWCTTSACGNRMKTLTYRRRHRPAARNTGVPTVAS